MKFIIKVAPEIIIKSKPVRKRTIRLLTKNIKVYLKYFDFVKVIDLWDRIDLEITKEIDTNTKQELIKIISFIPWIHNFYEVIEKDFVDLDSLFIDIKDYFLNKLEWTTFAVRVHRTWIHNFNSMEAERYLGGLFLKNSKNLKVKLLNPEISINIDIKENMYFVIINKYNWLGGYPNWFQEKVLSLISWWFDSWVSTYLSMKRWCEVDFLFFNLWGKAHELWVKQVANYLWKNFSKPYKSWFITINLEEVVKEIVTKVNHKYRWIILKRIMLKCANIVWQKWHFALVKWDSLWQVSSQTLINMSVINNASDMLVLRPLITYDKQEIIDIAKYIWTYNFACNMPEYCWVISDKPATKSDENTIIEEEKIISDEIIQRAIDTKKVEKVREMLKEDLENLEEWLEISYLPEKDEIVIDIRDPEKIEKDKLVIKWNKILEIPFYEINHKFTSLDHSKTYLFYCERGVLSKLHTLYLKEKWFQNIKVLRYDNNKIKCGK